MISRERAEEIRDRVKRFEEARKRFDPKRFQRGGGYSHEDNRTIAKMAGTDRPSNEELEVYAFHVDKPEHIFAYYRGQDVRVGDVISNWMGSRLGVVIHRGAERRPSGGRNVAIRMRGDNGVTYAGTCNLSSGTYCRLKKMARG